MEVVLHFRVFALFCFSVDDHGITVTIIPTAIPMQMLGCMMVMMLVPKLMMIVMMTDVVLVMVVHFRRMVEKREKEINIEKMIPFILVARHGSIATTIAAPEGHKLRAPRS